METGYKYFCVTLKSDQGKYNIWLSALNDWSAKQLAMTSQQCPKEAIVKIVEKTEKQFKNRNK